MAIRTMQDMEREFYEKVLSGEIVLGGQSMAWYDYNDAGTASTPISIAAADTWYALTNDGAGVNTASYPFSDVVDVWDTGSQAFDFSSLPLNTVMDIRLDVSVTTGSVNTAIDIDLFIDDGGAGEYQIPFIVENNYKTAGERRVIRYNGVYLGNAATRDGAARFKIKADSTGATVVVHGWYVKIHKP